MFQDSVPAGSYNDPFLSSVCFFFKWGPKSPWLSTLKWSNMVIHDLDEMGYPHDSGNLQILGDVFFLVYERCTQDDERMDVGKIFQKLESNPQETKCI